MMAKTLHKRFGLPLILMASVGLHADPSWAACEDLYLDPPDVALLPPIVVDDRCILDSRTIDLTLRTINNEGVIESAEGTLFEIHGSEFNNTGVFNNLGRNDSQGYPSDLPSELIIKGHSFIGEPPTIGRFIVTGELYNGPEAYIEVGTAGSLEGVTGEVINRGTIANVGQVNLKSELQSDSGYVGLLYNLGGLLANVSGGQWHTDAIVNSSGEIANYAASDWTVGMSLFNSAGGSVFNEGTMTILGTFVNFGTTDNRGLLHNQSELYLSGETLNMLDGTLLNDGDLVVDGGVLAQTGGVVINNSNLQIGAGGYQFAAGVIDNRGVMIDSGVSGGLDTPVGGSGNILNSGTLRTGNAVMLDTLENQAGTAFFEENLGARSVLNTGGNLTVGGRLSVDSNFVVTGGNVSATEIALGGLASANLEGGRLSVDHFIGDLANNGGTLAPGNSPGETLITGDYLQLIDAVLQIEIGGLTPGTEYDVLAVGGSAILGGTLEVLLYDFGADPFSPALGDSFDILSADTIIGEFDLLSLAMLDDGLDWDIEYIRDDFATDYVRLVVSTVPVPAAVWLFGTAIIGLAGFGRRRKIR